MSVMHLEPTSIDTGLTDYLFRSNCLESPCAEQGVTLLNEEIYEHGVFHKADTFEYTSGSSSVSRPVIEAKIPEPDPDVPTTKEDFDALNKSLMSTPEEKD